MRESMKGVFSVKRLPDMRRTGAEISIAGFTHGHGRCGDDEVGAGVRECVKAGVGGPERMNSMH